MWAGAPAGADFLCLHCAGEPLDPLERIDAWGEYREGLERLLVAFKFERHDFLDGPLASLLVRRWRGWEQRTFDAVVAVPMHPRKLRRRGYNQAELLARRFARVSGLPLLARGLRKVRENEAQSTLQREARTANVRRVFAAAAPVAAKSIILIDDICTTGATLRACAKALRDEGATRVVALTVARA
jgi:ComF family protein